MMPRRGAALDSIPHRFSAQSWIALAFALSVVSLSLIQAFYRLSLPWDGWSFARDATGGGQRLSFYQHLAAGSSPLQSGDILLAVQGQPFEDILSRALILQPQRPSNWIVGGTARYTVLRGNAILNVIVPIIRLTPPQILASLGRSWLLNPAPLLALLIAFVVFFRRADQLPARLLLLFSACDFASEGISQSIYGSNVVGLAELFYRSAYWPAQFFNSLIWPLLIGPLFLHLFLTFPVPKKPLQQHRRLTLVLLYGLTPLVILFAAGISFGQPLVFWGIWSSFSFIDLVLTLIIAIVSVGHTLLSVHDPTRRAQIHWVAWGTIITSLGALAGGVLAARGLLGQNLLVDLFAFRLPYLAFPISAGIAILRYHLFDIDIIIRRTLIYGLLTGILAVIYLAGIVVLEQLLRPFIGENSDLAVIVCTLGIAALFTPLRRKIQDWIDLRFYRSKYDAAQVLAAFSTLVRDEVELEKLTDHLLAVVSETIQPAHASLWLKRPTNRRTQWAEESEGIERG
jgi:hypothetical protein